MQQLLVASGPARSVPFGVGFNWFDFFGMGGHYARSSGYPLNEPVYPDAGDEQAWASIFEELGRWSPGTIRFGFPPDPHVSDHGALIRDTEHLARLSRVAEWAASVGCDILLDTYVIPEALGFPVPHDPARPADECINMAARDNWEFAERFVAPLLHHIVVERGLRAVRWFNPVNEPDHYGVYRIPQGGPDLYCHYVDMYAEMRQALDAVGLSRDIVGLVGVDKDLPLDWPSFEYLARGIDIDPYVDAYAFHSYRHRFDWSMESPACPDSDPLATLADRWIKRLASQLGRCGKPLVAAEIGTFHYGWRLGDPNGPATPEACILTAEAIIRMLNAGAAGAMVWSLINPDNIDGAWSMLRVEDALVLPSKHTAATYGMLMRHVPRGSKIHRLVPAVREYPQHVHGTLLRDPSGHVHVLLVNDHPESPREVTITLPPDSPVGPWLRRVKDRAGASFDVVPPPRNLIIRDRLAPMALHVFSSDSTAIVLPDAD